MADSPAPDADPADSRSEDSGSGGASRPAAVAELQQMFAPVTGFVRDFFRGDHPQHRHRLIGAWVVAGLLVGGLGWSLYDSTSTQAGEVTWGNWIGVPTEVNKAMIRSLIGKAVLTGEGVSNLRVEVYKSFLKDNPDADPKVRSWARLLLAETYLRLALQRGYVSDRNASRNKGELRISTGRSENITKAKKDFERVLDGAPEGSELRQRALFGLAVVAEATCSGDKKSIGKAVAAYKKLEATEGPYKELASSRRKTLENAGTAEFYQWFVQVSESPAPARIDPLGGAGAGSGGDPFGAGLLKDLTGGHPESPGPRSPPDADGKDARTIPDSVPLFGKKKPGEKKAGEKKAGEKKPAEKKKSGE